MYERLEVASVKKILIFSKHLYCNRFLRQSQTETTRPTKNHFLVGLLLFAPRSAILCVITQKKHPLAIGERVSLLIW